jgi:phosphoserine phosphatase
MSTYKLVVFDMDGVLVNYESSWTWVHDKMGVDNEEAFGLFKKGKITEIEFIRRDIGLWIRKDPNIRIGDIVDLLHDIPLIPGIQETVATLSHNGIKSVIVSGGIDKAAEMISNEYGFDAYAANSILAYPDGTLTGDGKVNVDLTDKGIVTRELMKRYGAGKEETVAIGNSFTDVKMLQAAGFAIAFNPIDEAVVSVADKVVRSNNLSDILELVLCSEDGEKTSI